MSRVRCPGCKQVIHLPDSAAGAVGHCPDCGQAFHVPPTVIETSSAIPHESIQVSAASVQCAEPDIFTIQAGDEPAVPSQPYDGNRSRRRREAPPGMVPIPLSKRLAGGLFCFGMALFGLVIFLAVHAHKPRPRYLFLAVTSLLAFTVWGMVLLCTRYEDADAARQVRLRRRGHLRGMGKALKFAWPWFVALGAVWGIAALFCLFQHGQGLAVYGIILASFGPMLVSTAWFYIVAKWDGAPVKLAPGVIWSPERRMLVADYLAANPRRAGVPLLVGGFGGLLFVLMFPVILFSERMGTAPLPTPQPAGAAGGDGDEKRLPEVPRPRAAGEPPAATRFPGLLGYWSLDEEDGTKAADASGRGEPATLANARRVPGVRGSAVSFSGNDSYLDYGSSPDFNFAAGAPFTFAGWLRTARTDGTLLSQRNTRTPAPVIDLTLEGSQLCGLVRQDGVETAQSARVASAGPVNDGQWHHFALTRDSSGQIELFVDGASQARAVAGASGGAITTDWRTVGLERYWVRSGRLFGKPDFDGSIDELCVFGRTLKAEEIQSLSGR